MNKFRYTVIVRERDSGIVVKEVECGESYRRAEQVEDGININLNRDKYYTDVDQLVITGD